MGLRGWAMILFCMSIGAGCLTTSPLAGEWRLVSDGADHPAYENWRYTMEIGTDGDGTFEEFGSNWGTGGHVDSVERDDGSYRLDFWRWIDHGADQEDLYSLTCTLAKDALICEESSGAEWRFERTS